MHKHADAHMNGCHHITLWDPIMSGLSTVCMLKCMHMCIYAFNNMLKFIIEEITDCE